MPAVLAVAIVSLMVPEAHGADVVTPGAGTLLQELKPALPPAAPQVPLDLDVGRFQRADIPASAPFAVRDFRLSGNSAFETTVLQRLLDDSRGRELTLPELFARVARISDFYHAHGYPLARATIPAQTLSDGLVDVVIVEARYGSIEIDNRSRVNTRLLDATLAPLTGGRLIRQSDLEHVLLLLSDIPGAAQSATLQPGRQTGTSNLVVRENATAPFNSQVAVDNDGNRFTGRVRGGGEIAFYEPFAQGDVADASLLTSGDGLQYGRLSYDVLLDGSGTRVGVAYSALHYRLGDSLQVLGGHGTAQVASVWIRRPLLRTQDANAYTGLEYDHKTLRDDIDGNAIRTHRHLDDGALSLTGDWRDGLWSGGANTWSLQWTFGGVYFDDAQAMLSDALTAHTQGAFSEWNLGFTRIQRVSRQDSLALTFAGQAANGNLDSAQKLTAGGRFGVRAYETSALSGDAGVQAGVEARHTLESGWHGQWQLLGFVEAQHLTINKSPWTGGRNDATLGGAGLGVAWTHAGQWSARAYIASRLGATPALIGDASLLRGWFELSKGFQ